MSKTRKPQPKQAVKRQSNKRGERTVFSVTMFALLIFGVMAGLELFGASEPSKAEIRIPPPVVQEAPAVAPTVGAVKVTGGSLSPLPFDAHVGIVSGHKGYDPGAVCPDGLTEAQVNYSVAVEVVSLLERRGVKADILDEFDDRLTDYQADALVSIHSDSCMVPGATGFKVARVTESAIPEAEDRLVACLYQEYKAYTGLPEHPASITDNMTNYHAFREIARTTPGAIIETGFMLEDRFLLQYKPKILARGIAAGILCFLNTAEAAPAP